MRKRKYGLLVTRGSHVYDRTLDRIRDPGVLLIVISLLAVFFLVTFSIVYPEIASAAPVSPGGENPWETDEGRLFFKDGEDGFSLASLEKTEVEIDVVGIVAKAKVRQYFANDRDSWMEGDYAFPLPEDAAVTGLWLQVGDRQLEGRVEEKIRAHETYREAKEAGKKTSLLKQRKPNIFVASVANIGPGEKVSVEIEYQQIVLFRDDTFSLRFPTVIGPRYLPGTENGETGLRPLLEDAFQTETFPSPGEPPVNPTSIVVNLDTGLPLASIESPYHSIVVESHADDSQTITLDNEWVYPSKDFVLRWRPARGMGPHSAVFVETRDDADYLLLLIMPPVSEATQLHLMPREVHFVLDVSGSMAGASIRQAKKALGLAVERLTSRDRFNLITFNDRAHSLFGEARPAKRGNKDEALRYVARLDASGGTEMESGLRMALDGEEHSDRIRQVVFLTDGCVGNEERLFGIIENGIRDCRLFTVGIGSAPNGYFMKKAAAAGRGSFTYIGSTEEVGERMEALFAKLEAPVLTDIELSMPAVNYESFPYPLPDLYIGEPFVAVVKADRVPEIVSLQGVFAGRKWRKEIDPHFSSFLRGISTFWARKMIAALDDDLRAGVRQEKEVRRQILDLALEHHLVRKYTSLVVVDTTPARPPDEELIAARMKTKPPEGWPAGVLSSMPRTATVAELCMVLGAMAILLSNLLFWLLLRLRMKAKGVLKTLFMLCFIGGCVMLGNGFFIKAKAAVAQISLVRAWEKTVRSGHRVRPWP